MRVCGVRTAPKNAKGFSTLALLSFLLFCAAEVFGQGSLATGNPVVTNGIGQPLAGATVAICTANPGVSPVIAGCPSTLATTYTDITDSVSCTGIGGVQPLNNLAAPSVGSGCSNPGLTDSGGNVVAFSGASTYWCEYYGQGIIGIKVIPCIFPSNVGGSNLSSPPAIGNTTPNIGAFTGLNANGTYSPTFYGAKCDGVTDDTAAFASALTAAASGGVIAVPASTAGCYLASALTISSNSVTLRGVGWSYGAQQAPSTLLFAAGVNGIVASGNAVSVENLFVKSKDTGANSDVGIHFTGGRPYIERVTVQSFGGAGFEWDSAGGKNVDHWYAADLRALSNFGDGFLFVGGTDTNAGTGVNMDASLNGGIGFNLSSSGVNENTFIGPLAATNTGGDYVIAGASSSNYFLNAYCESGTGSSFIIGASDSFNQVVFPNFGLCTTITNNGGQSNQIYYSYSSSPGVAQIFLNPPPGTAVGSGQTYELSSGIFNPKDFDIRDVTGTADLLDYNHSLLGAGWFSLKQFYFTNFAGATSGGSTNSGIGGWFASCWNGSTAQNDYFTTQVIGGSGTNGTEVLTHTHVPGCGVTGSESFLYPISTTFLTSSAGGALALSTSAIGAHTCSAAQTLTVTGTTTSSLVSWSFAATPIGVTGYGDVTTPFLVVTAFPTANTANIVVCNVSAGSITPGAISVNIRVTN